MAQGAHDYILLFYGPPGVGKTSFVNSLGNVLFISTDRGTRWMRGMREEVNSYEDVVEIIDALEEDCSAYDMVCIDHMDDFAIMAEEWSCKELGIDALGDAGYGKGWNTYKKAMRSVISRLKSLNLGVVFICHEAIKTIRTRAVETERTMPDLPKSAWKVVVPLADLVGYLGFKRVKKGGKPVEARTLQTMPSEDIYCKDRTSRKHPTRGYEILAEPPRGGKAFMRSFSNPNPND